MIDPAIVRRHRPVLVLVGPTAVGKSALALALAQRLGTEVLAADSRQVYRGMAIATDTPPMGARQGVPHRLIDCADPDEPCNAGRYVDLARVEIARLHEAGQLPLIVGGTGLWVRALLGGLCEAAPSDAETRQVLERELAAVGAQGMHARLSEVDPASAARLHPNDRVKVLRALEVHRLTGRRLSDLHADHTFSARAYPSLQLGLTRDRADLYARIEQRIDRMMARGLVDEVRTLLTAGYSRELGSMKGLGYKQIAGYLAGEYDEAEAVRLLKRDTRHYAKRQLTWFRKEPDVRWCRLAPGDEATSLCDEMLGVVAKFFDDLAAADTAADVR
ncbi:MAG: tRNA (adenosine(37)-N6)-dimethylallyltransferase MiaA [Nitrospiraceae bacterium]